MMVVGLCVRIVLMLICGVGCGRLLNRFLVLQMCSVLLIIWCLLMVYSGWFQIWQNIFSGLFCWQCLVRCCMFLWNLVDNCWLVLVLFNVLFSVVSCRVSLLRLCGLVMKRVMLKFCRCCNCVLGMLLGQIRIRLGCSFSRCLRLIWLQWLMEGRLLIVVGCLLLFSMLIRWCVVLSLRMLLVSEGVRLIICCVVLVERLRSRQVSSQNECIN